MADHFNTLDIATTTEGSWVFDVTAAAYGAKGDGTTDDTTAIKNAVADAVTYAQNNQGYAEVKFGSRNYLVGGALTQGGSTHGNAQIPIPTNATTAQKVTLVLRGSYESTGLYHWQQTADQKPGAFLISTRTGTNDGTYGEATVVGGPNPKGGYGESGSVFSNMLVVVAGLGIQVPNDPHICGFDFRGLAEVNVINASVMAAGGVSSFGSTSNSTQTWQFGLCMPQNNNNANCNIGYFSAEGLNYGLHTDEHTIAQSVRAIHCVAGIEHVGPGGSTGTTGHRARVYYACIEACQVCVGAINASPTARFDIDVLDVEATSFAIINDPGNSLNGYIGLSNGTTSFADPSANTDLRGCGQLRVIDLNGPRGHVAAPSVPASATALTNPFNRDAMVVVSGGTVSAIAVGGTATGLTSGAFLVPAGIAIKLTYTVAPSWTWTLS